MSKFSDIYREDAAYVQRSFEAEQPIRVSKEYMRKLRFQVFNDRGSSSVNNDETRSSATGY